MKRLSETMLRKIPQTASKTLTTTTPRLTPLRKIPHLPNSPASAPRKRREAAQKLIEGGMSQAPSGEAVASFVLRFL
jgi:hypothetical protein